MVKRQMQDRTPRIRRVWKLRREVINFFVFNISKELYAPLQTEPRPVIDILP